MKLLNIITPVSRIENLPLLYDNLSYYAKGVKIIWWVILDNSLRKHYQNICLNENAHLEIKLLASPYKNSIGGYAQRNMALDLLEENKEQWVYNLDDDNILHPGFMDFFINDDKINNCDVVLIAQVFSNGNLRLRADVDLIKVLHVDIGMYLFKLKALGDLRFIEDYCADGHLAEALKNNENNKFYINDTPLCYYNYLRDSKYELMNTLLSTCPVPVLQEEWEFSTLLNLYKNLHPKNVLEIGSFYGGTLWFWLNNSTKLDRIVSVDHPILPEDGRYAEMIASKSLWNTWVKSNIAFKEIKGDSTTDFTVHQVFDIFPEKNVDFLFIDGGQDYKTIKSDYENYSEIVRPGGMIVFHDIAWLQEVRKYWNEVKIGKAYVEIYNSRGGWGTGIIYK